MRHIIVLIFFYVFVFKNSIAQLDSTNYFHQNDFLAIVMRNHPLVKQAQLITKRGELNLQNARGKFDPHLFYYFDEKQYNNVNYYNIMSGGLKVPTWFGLEGKVSYDNATGSYFNNERKVPDAGLISAGVSMPIGKGLFIDERRNHLQQAKIFNKLSEQKQFMAVNKILFEAIKAYWDWVMAYNHKKIYQSAIELAKVRFEGVKESFEYGAEPAIDTLEAFIQLQSRQFSYNETKLQYLQAGLKLSNYLWDEDGLPLEVTENIYPPEILDEFHNYLHTDEDVHGYHNFDIEKHPIIIMYEYKLDQLKIEKRYKAESLKPKLNINYNFLNEPIAVDSYLSQISPQNYKFGVEFSFPLFLREARSDFRLTKVKLEETSFQRMQSAREIRNEIESSYQELKNLELQEQLFTINTVNYERLLEAEKQKFDLGESSLFLINSREINVIESQIKLINLRGKYQKSIASLTYSTGQTLIENP